MILLKSNFAQRGYGVLHKELAIDGLEEKYKNYINNEISYVFDAK